MITKNRWLGWIIVALVVLMIIAGFLAWQSPALSRLPAKRPTSSPSTLPMVISSPPTDRPWPAGDWGALYLVHDWRLGPQNASDWRQSYPGWQMVGGWIEATWEAINPSEGKYDFSHLIQYVESSAGRPVAINILLHGEEEAVGKRFADWTPAWVYDEIAGRPVVDGRPVGYRLQPEGCDRPAALPMYDHPTWQHRVDELIAALAEQFDHPDRYPNLQAISIGWGFEGLDEPTHDVVCAYSTQLDPALQDAFEIWADHLLAELSARFHHRLVWMMTTPDNADERAKQLDGHAASNLGLMIVQPTSESSLPKTSVLRAYSMSLPIGWRLAEPNTLAQTYWGLLNAAAQGVDWVDIQWAHLLTAETIQRETSFDLLLFTRDYAGRHPRDAPGAWALFGLPATGVINEAPEEAVNACTSGLHPDIHQQNRLSSASDLTGTPARFGHLPLRMEAGWGTEESRGIDRIEFDLKAAWEQRLAVEDNQRPATLRIIYLDRGQDTFDIIYPVQGRQLARRRVIKANTGQWAQAQFPIMQPAWGSLSEPDLVIDSNGDGDELLHLVEIHQASPSDVPSAPAAGWELLDASEMRVSEDQSLATKGENDNQQLQTYTENATALMNRIFNIPLLIWLLAVAAIGLFILAVRLLTFNKS